MKTVAVYPNADKDADYSGTAQVIEALGKNIRIRVDETLRAELSKRCPECLCTVDFVRDDALFDTAEAAIVLGGDGTILRAARRCAPCGVPLIGINLGRVGYMAELELDELSMLRRLETGEYTIERRMMLEASFGKKTSYALNDAVLGAESVFKMADIELYCDGKLVNRYRADGLIAATPTGSTAYSLSAGGAVIDPCMDAMMVTPICSHSLNTASIVFSAGSVLEMRNVDRRTDRLYLGIDGCETHEINYRERVIIRPSPLRVHFIRMKNDGFYGVMRKKMAETL